jgi:hypothetical protein
LIGKQLHEAAKAHAAENGWIYVTSVCKIWLDDEYADITARFKEAAGDTFLVTEPYAILAGMTKVLMYENEGMDRDEAWDLAMDQNPTLAVIWALDFVGELTWAPKRKAATIWNCRSRDQCRRLLIKQWTRPSKRSKNLA